MKGIPVLMYHALEDETHPAGVRDNGEQLYVLDVGQFYEQMNYLHEEGFKTMLLEELLSSKEWPENGVVLTFDDGHESNYILALPILKEFGFKAEFFITTGWIGMPHYMSTEQIRSLHVAGMSIGSHGVSHAFLDDLTDVEVKGELIKSSRFLSDIIGRPIISFSAPGGRLNPGLDQITSDYGYKIVCTSRWDLCNSETSSLAIPRFVIKRSTTLSTFIRIVNKDVLFLNTMQIFKKGLALAKTILGNQGYSYLHRYISNWRNKSHISAI